MTLEKILSEQTIWRWRRDYSRCSGEKYGRLSALHTQDREQPQKLPLDSRQVLAEAAKVALEELLEKQQRILAPRHFGRLLHIKGRDLEAARLEDKLCETHLEG